VSDLKDWISPARTALLIIDMQADFGATGGLMDRLGADVSATPAALAAAGRLADAAREAQARVIFVGLQNAPDSLSPAWLERTRRQGGPTQIDAQPCLSGSPGAAFIGPQPQADDWVIAKRRYSAFFGTNLDARLRQHGIDTLVLCGLTTECCVHSAASDAFHLDYHVFIAADACAAYGPDLHQSALKSLALNCAIIVDVAQVKAVWECASAPTN